MLKILFLDIDGVVNTSHTKERHGPFIGIDPDLASKIVSIQKLTGCKIVLSSTWRLDEESIKEVERHIGELYSMTPHLPKEIRGEEIQIWLDLMQPKESEPIRYAIVDDCSSKYMLKSQLPHFFGTDGEVGITNSIGTNIIIYLNQGSYKDLD